MKLLENKVAIVTGASSGIGRSAATLFANHGAKLMVTARRAKALDTLVGEIEDKGGEAVALAGNITDEAHARSLSAATLDRFGRLDIAFNNAGGVGPMAPGPDLSVSAWRDTLETNLTGAFLAAKYQLPAMRETGGGSMIFTSSFVGFTAGLPGMAAYAAAKAGLIGLVQVLAAEFGPDGIRVNALLPGGTDTPGATIETAEDRAFVEGLHALKRIASPEEIAQSALFLASDMSSFTTGSPIFADGGVSINRT
ncbi:SDR family oxidoreductase [Parasphingopyxis algicola]|uniref:SDR family oxidoreductase n=1 Tax=Parasphingopyxis algicola TaxID=2026624 RepID=UPI0015A202CD|nr:SDR family oxidoreductase [Parasphingopyxis algicola]QLC24700.1 SDR family oxidoreductase [Parasphingopyxis algicola]